MEEFKDKVVVITGGAKGIGRCIAEMFMAQGARVCVIDLLPGPYETDFCFQGDIGQETVLRTFANEIIAKYSRVDYLINNALPLFKGIDSWRHVSATGAGAMRSGSCVISLCRGHMP